MISVADNPFSGEFSSKITDNETFFSFAPQFPFKITATAASELTSIFSHCKYHFIIDFINLKEIH